MGAFFEQYKKLDGYCRALLSTDAGVTEYINIMKEVPEQYKQQIPGFDDDLKKLRIYRRIRNQIAHEEGKNEADLCKQKDIMWLSDFCNRIKAENDPISVYNKLLKEDKEKSAEEKKKFPLWGKIVLGGTALAGAIAAVLAGIFSNKD